jgi:nitrite reductase (NO-forming)
MQIERRFNGMNAIDPQSSKKSLWTDAAAGAIRAAFGLAWALDAYFKWRPVFFNNYLSYITGISDGQPAWLLPWFHLWDRVISPDPTLFAWLTRLVETVIAIGLLAGFARKWIYVLGAAFALVIWSVPEGFGGPYVPGATDVGAGLIYAFLFLALILIDYALGRSPYSVDFYLERKFPAWHKVAEWAPAAVLEKEPGILSWPVQIVVILGLLVMLTVFLIILGGELNSAPAGQSALTHLTNLAHLLPII